MTRAIDLNFEEAIKALERHVQTLGKVAFQAQNAAIDLAKRNEALEAALKKIANGAARDMISRREIERIALTALGEQ